MRVGVNAAFLGKAHNGQSTYIRGLIRALRDHGLPRREEYVIYTAIEDAVPRAEPNFEWRKTPYWVCHESKPFGNIARVLWTQLILPLLLARDKIDILLSPLSDAPVFSKTPTVVVVHDLIPLFYPQESARLALYFRSIVPLFLRNADRIVTDSEHTKRDLVRAYHLNGDRIVVVPLGVDDSYYSRDSSCDAPPSCPEKYFLFVGACLPRKNPLDVIRAFARVQDRLKEKLVLVTSTGIYLDEIQRAVQELRLSNRVVVYTDVPQQQMLFLYRHTTALILLSEYEGFGYPAAEALASGSPAIVSAGSSLPEVVGDAGVIVRSGDLQAVASAMTELARDPGLRKRLQERGRVRSEAFRWKVIAEKVRSLFLSTLDRQGEDAFSYMTLQG